MKTKAQQRAMQAAINKYGMENCIAAYNLNVEHGEGGTMIEINTGIPKRNQGAAIAAGEAATGAYGYWLEPAGPSNVTLP